jgi:hypothetical protein
MSQFRIILILGLVLMTTSCATGDLGAPAPTLETLQLARRAGVPSMQVGAFSATPGMPGRTVVIRAGTMSAPKGTTFADYLRDSLASELAAAGKLDSKSEIVINGLLSESEVDSAMPTANAKLGAHFSVTRGQLVIYQKNLSVHSQWPSAFLGAEAIPDAMNHYTALYDQLIQTLLADPEFLAAVKK